MTMSLEDYLNGAAFGVSTLSKIGGTLLGGSSSSDEYERRAYIAQQEAKYQQVKNQWETALRNQSLKYELSKMNVERTSQVGKLRRQGKLAMGQAMASLGRSGVVASSGSPMQALSDISAQSDLDLRTTLYNDAVERNALIYNTKMANYISGLETQYKVENLLSQAGLYNEAATDTRTSSYFQAGVDLLGSVLTIGSFF